MHASDLDQAYTYLCQTLTRVGPEQSEMFLARLALLALQTMRDADAAVAWIDAAAKDVVSG